MSAGIHDPGGAFNENVVYLVIDNPDASLIPCRNVEHIFQGLQF